MRTIGPRTRQALAAGALAVALASLPTLANATADDAAARMHPEGTLKVTDREIHAGATFEIGGEKFASDGTLELMFVGLVGDVPLGEVTADSVGSFHGSFAVPANLDAGAYRLVAIAADGDEVASLDMSVLAAVLDPAGDDAHAEVNGGDAGAHSDAAEPTDEPLALDRASNPWVTGGAIAGILFAIVGGGVLLRRPADTL
jgi:hypothetical protein